MNKRYFLEGFVNFSVLKLKLNVKINQRNSLILGF